jgi:hypothetical protein
MWHSVAALAVLMASPADRYFQDPHPFRTLFRGPVLRLLDDPQTRLSLGLNSQQSAKLVEFTRDLDRQQDELFSRTEEDLNQRLELLRSPMEARQKKLIAQFERDVGQAAKRKLIGFALHFWGEMAPFAVGVAEELGVTKAQRTAAEAVVKRFETKRLEISTDKAKPEDFEIVSQALEHDLAKLVTSEQRRKRDELAGNKPTWAPELFVEKEAAREERENRPPVKQLYRDPRRMLRLLHIDDALDLLKIQGEDRRQLLKFVKEAAKEEDSLAMLKKKDEDTLRLRTDKLASFDERIHKELAERLGPKKWDRALQLRLQLMGPGAAFGVAVRKELGIPDAQFQQAIKQLQEATDKRHHEDERVTDEVELRKRQAKRQQEFDALLLGALTGDQRKKWTELLGEPFDKNALSRISRRL